MTDYRVERDSMGEVRLPAGAYYGAQTQRAVENFPISGRPLPPELIHAIGLVKWAAASANRDLGKLGSPGKLAPVGRPRSTPCSTPAARWPSGRFDDQFPVDVFQTGSGTSSNMNANEVIANRAIELSGGDRFLPDKPIHPNDHVNMGQSTNDTFPTAIHVAVALGIERRADPGAGALPAGAGRKGGRLGRRCSRSAAPTWPTPRRCRWARRSAGWRGSWSCRSNGPRRAQAAVLELPVGGTAVGTRHQHPPRVRPPRVRGPGRARRASRSSRRPTTSRPTPSATGWSSATASCARSPRRCSTWPTTSAGWAPGPRCGFYEVKLPDLQPGSSIMPGKVNPVLCESLMQVAARVMGNDQAIALCGAAGGQFQLNVMMPVMADTALESVRLLARRHAAVRRPLRRGHGGQPRGLRGRRGKEPVDGHRP